MPAAAAATVTTVTESRPGPVTATHWQCHQAQCHGHGAAVPVDSLTNTQAAGRRPVSGLGRRTVNRDRAAAACRPGPPTGGRT